MLNTLKNKSFTLIELIVVIVIIASMASFALVNYNKSLLAAHERDAIMQLKTIHAAESIQYSKDGFYWPLDSSIYDLTDINDNLDVYVFSGDIVYTCSGFDGGSYDCSGTYSAFEVSIDQGEISPSNPCCSSGVCPTLSNCS